MTTPKKIHIVGAGLSGMVAALNLAREGYQVLVLEKGAAVGGGPPHHPSCHYTPLITDWLWDYIGIDLGEFFHPVKDGNLFIARDKFGMPLKDFFMVERGPRKTAVDGYLYQQCLDAGVKFEFKQEIRDPLDLPDPTILATGLHKEMGHALGLPMLRLPCFGARKNLDSDLRDGHVYCWMGDYSETYAYASIINKLDYYLLFSDGNLTELDLKRFEVHLLDTLGLKFDKWDYFEVWVPLNKKDAPRLFSGSKILAGTLAGMMDPSFYFGIHGAMVSGKVAAQAVSDPEGAAAEFKRLTKNYRAAYMLRTSWKHVPRNSLMRISLRLPIIHPLLKLIRPGIPGLEISLTTDIPRYQGKI